MRRSIEEGASTEDGGNMRRKGGYAGKQGWRGGGALSGILACPIHFFAYNMFKLR